MRWIDVKITADFNKYEDLKELVLQYQNNIIQFINNYIKELDVDEYNFFLNSFVFENSRLSMEIDNTEFTQKYAAYQCLLCDQIIYNVVDVIIHALKHVLDNEV